MRTINLHEAKARLSRLVKEAAEGKPFIIAKSGKPMVRVTALEKSATRQGRRLGFLVGKIKVPSDFDRMGKRAVAALFGGRQNSA